MSSADVWLLSNGIGGVAFAGLTLLLCVNARERTEGRLLALACGMNALWCLLMASAIIPSVEGPVLDIAETARDGAWLAFLTWLLPRGVTSRHRAITIAAIALPVLLFSFLAWRIVFPEGGDAVAQRSPVFFAGAATMAFCALLMLEQIYRGAKPDERWGLKYLALGIGMLFAYDFVMYSRALFYIGIPLSVWDARGAVNALAAPLIAVSAARNAAWSTKLRLSHQAAFHTGAVVAAGSYLLFTALGAYYIRNFGGTWSEVFGVLFVVVTLLLLSVMMLSGQIRAQAKVWMRKHFFDYKYDYREEWLGLTRRLSHAEAEFADPYQRSIRAVAHILESPAGALWLLREGRYQFVSQWNMAAAEDTQESPDSPLVAFMRERRWVVDLAEHTRDSSSYSYDHLDLPAWLADIPRARLVVPLFFESELLGFMVLAVPRADYLLIWEDLDLLRTLGTQVGSFLGQQESHVALAQARQFEAYNRLTAFLMHDLKNIASQQSLILQNAQKHKHNPDFVDDMIMTVDSSVGRMRRLLEQLQRNNAQQDHTRRVDVGVLLDRMLATLSVNEPVPTIACAAPAFVHVDPERFEMILGHVIRNAQEATGVDGRVDVNVRTEVGTVFIAVIDDGEGMTPAFVRESLFRPFFSTKSARGMGIGAYQARDFARTAGGEVKVESVPNEGTTFTITIPAVDGPAREGRPMAAEI